MNNDYENNCNGYINEDCVNCSRLGKCLQILNEFNDVVNQTKEKGDFIARDTEQEHH